MKRTLLLLAFVTSLLSSSQTLDTSFGTNGIVTTQISTTPTTDVCIASVLQTDLKTIFVARNELDNYYVTRTNTNGSLDNSFNFIGYRYFKGIQFTDVALQSDGKIVLVSNGLTYRLNSDGSFDTTFGNGGVVNVDINTLKMVINAVVIQNDGKILLIGATGLGDFAIIRLNTNGSFDTTFDGDGKISFDINNANDNALDAIVQPDGKIVVTGESYPPGNTNANNDISTIRVNSNGSLDTSFAVNGISVLQFGANSYDVPKDIALQSDGKIVIVATTISTKITLIRLNTNGTLDTTFDSDGSISTSYNTASPGNNKPKVRITSSGKILSSFTLNNDYCLIQFNSDGSVDTSFGTNGKVTYNANALDRSCYLYLKPNNEIVTGGSSIGNGMSKIQQITFNSSGIYSSSFDFNLNATSDEVSAIEELSNGKVLALIDTKPSSGDVVSILYRYNIDGSIDTTFGTNGYVNTFTLKCNKIKVQNDGKILILMGSIFLYRFNADGSVDNSFGTNGMVEFSLNTYTYINMIDNIYKANDGTIYLLYDYYTSTGEGFPSYGLLKLNSNGTINTNFGVNCIVTTRFNFYGNSSYEWPIDVVQQSDNKFVITGVLNSLSTQVSKNAIGTTRFNTDGSLDTTFGTNGIVVTQIANNNNAPRQLIVCNDDKFLINTSNITEFSPSATIKYNANGSIDATFGSNGIVLDQNNNQDMVMQTDGKFIKAGQFNGNFSTSRYTASGNLDPTFGASGYLNTTINQGSTSYKLLLVQNGKLLVVGSSNTANRIATQARYTNLNLSNTTNTLNNTAISVYPNPLKDTAYLQFTLEQNEPISVAIIDMQGRVIEQLIQDKPSSKGNHIEPISLSSNISAGNYFIQLSTPSQKQSLQIIKID